MYEADAAHHNTSLEEKLNSIFTMRVDTRIDISIRPEYYVLLERLDNPHQNLPPVIHVAGTNGKGSTIAFLRALLENHGKDVHTYTSPHLKIFNERIVLAGQQVDDQTLETALDFVLSKTEGLPLTFFEVTTALAFFLFAAHPADYCLLETGLGGRLDCTNVVENPLRTLITSIGFDHMEFLGDTIESIAQEKAGIMKADAPCVISPQPNEHVWPVFTNRAKNIGTEIIKTKPEPLPELGLKGVHQQENALTALTCFRSLELDTQNENLIREGLKNAHWPARLQQIKRADLLGLLPAESEIWYDGGHNEAAGQALAAQAKHWKTDDPKTMVIICGMMTSKNPVEFLRTLASFADQVICIPLSGHEASYDPKDMAYILHSHSIEANIASSVYDALSQYSQKDEAVRALICGSLYLAEQLL